MILCSRLSEDSLMILLEDDLIVNMAQMKKYYKTEDYFVTNYCEKSRENLQLAYEYMYSKLKAPKKEMNAYKKSSNSNARQTER